MATDPRTDKRSQVGVLGDILPAKANSEDQFPLQLHVHGLRVLAGTVTLVSLLLLITGVLLHGVKISTLDASQLSDEDRRAVLDQYNSYSGSIASILSMPFQQLPAMLLPVFFLCFTTHAVLAENKSLVMEWGPVISLAAVSYVLGLGLSSLNVQFDSPQIEFNMAATDLMTPRANTSNFSTINYLTSTTNIAGVPSTDTVLRSAIVPSIVTSKSSCANIGIMFTRKPEASVRFGFPLNSWLDSLQTKSIASSRSFKFSMDDDFTTQQVDLARFPSGDIRKTAVLLTCAFTAVLEQFISESRFINSYADNLTSILTKAIDSPDAPSLLTNIQNAVSNASIILDEVDAQWDFNASNFWNSIATAEITVELSSFEISPQISFEAVTFELPLKMDTSAMEDWLAVNHWGKKGTTETTFRYACTKIGCVIGMPNAVGTNQDQVRLLPLCADGDEWRPNVLHYQGECETISNSSVLVYSLARHIVTEEGVMDNLEWNGNLTLSNVRPTFRATVGRLAWTTDDLASMYGSTCTQGVNCHGLSFQLDDGQRHLVLGEDHIPIPQQSAFYDASQWQVLAMASTQIDDATQGDIVGYRLTAEYSAMIHEDTLPDELCIALADDYVSDIIERHIYSKDSMQPAYTAVLFWLFQNAGVKQIATSEASNSSGVRLLLDGNRSWISAHAAMPFVSACVTFAGCGLTLILGLLIAYRSDNQQHQAALAHQIAAHNVSAVLADANQFPPLLVSVGVKKQQVMEPHRDSSMTLDPIDRFEILQTTIMLRDRETETIRNVAIGNCSNLTPDEVKPTRVGF